MSWWWAGATGAVKKRLDECTAAAEPSFQCVALILGSTGIVGTSLLDILLRDDTPGEPWKVYAVSHRAPPTWSTPPPSPAVTHLQLDLADPAAVAEALGPLADVTASSTQRGRATRRRTRIGRSTPACSATCSSWRFVQLCSTQLWSAPGTSNQYRPTS